MCVWVVFALVVVLVLDQEELVVVGQLPCDALLAAPRVEVVVECDDGLFGFELVVGDRDAVGGGGAFGHVWVSCGWSVSGSICTFVYGYIGSEVRVLWRIVVFGVL